MTSYTIEDIDLIRRKSGISYEEAVNLLEYHNGNLAKALVDLERNGRITHENAEKPLAAENQHPQSREKTLNILQNLYQTRFQVRKDSTIVVNLSLLFIIPTVILAPYIVLIGLVCIFALGYRMKIVRNAPEFKHANLEKMVKSAAQNVKDSIEDFTRDFSQPSKEDSEPQGRSFYRPGDSASAPSEQTASAAQTSSTPVVVHCSEDGSVHINEERDGSTSATID